MLQLIIGLVFAVIAWFVLFGARAVNFWWGMTAASGILAAWSLAWAGDSRKNLFRFKLSYILWGLLSAAILYMIFWLGDAISTRILSFASGQIDAIYGNKGRLDPRLVGLLLFFWIGPAEEIFWRGLVQRALAQHFGANFGWLAGALIYAAVHLWAGNFVLFMAALIAGLFWGWIYKHFGSLWPGIISHSVWDVAIFLVLPV
jgi:membrane protease YdiL (CAAX protease family)